MEVVRTPGPLKAVARRFGHRAQYKHEGRVSQRTGCSEASALRLPPASFSVTFPSLETARCPASVSLLAKLLRALSG